MPAMPFLLGFDHENWSALRTASNVITDKLIDGTQNVGVDAYLSGTGSTTGFTIDYTTARWPSTAKGSLKLEAATGAAFGGYNPNDMTAGVNIGLALRRAGTRAVVVAGFPGLNGSLFVKNIEIGISAQQRLYATDGSNTIVHPRILIPTTWYRLEINLIKSGTNINAILTINQQPVSGTFTLGGIQSVYWSLGTARAPGYPTTGNIGNAIWYDDLVVDGGGLGDVKIESLAPVADVAKTWTTSSGTTHYTLINEIPPNDDTTYLTNTNGNFAAEMFTVAAIPTTAKTVHAIQYDIYARNLLRAPSMCAVSNGTAQGAAMAVLGSYKHYIVHTVTDATGVAWNTYTPGNVNANPIGFEQTL